MLLCWGELLLAKRTQKKLYPELVHGWTDLFLLAHLISRFFFQFLQKV